MHLKKVINCKVKSENPDFERKREYILKDQNRKCFSKWSGEDIGSLKIWYPEKLGCCDTFWKVCSLRDIDYEIKEWKIEKRRLESIPPKMRRIQ